MSESRGTNLPGWLDPLYDPEEMRAADRFAMEQRGILELELAEKAGAGLAAAAADLAGAGPVRVVVGPGNNGGDGLVAARLLREAGREVDVLAPLALDGLGGVPRTNLDRLPGPAPRPFDPAALVGSGAIVDALLGTGFEGAVREPLAGVIAGINASDAPVVAADVPSGVNAATGEVEGLAVRAGVTTTNHAPKIGLYVAPGSRHAGAVRVVDIGIPRGAPGAGVAGLISRRVLRLVPPRPPSGSKHGVVLVAGGARGSTGAPSMAAMAAMRAGAGYVRVAVPASAAPTVDLRLLEALIHGLEEEEGRHVEAGARTVAGLAAEAGSVVLGPGLDPTSGAFTRAVGLSVAAPMVIDVDGLLAYPSPESLAERPGPTVLIPDPAGLERLLGTAREEVEARRLASARALADRSGAVVVLEGDGTIVAAPGGLVALGLGASGALATNGTGYVLAGLVGALLSKGMDPFPAAAAAVLARATAGELAAARVGEDHTVAGDVIEALPRALSGPG
jgi:hydroxyethylthiazole kinase-like uncharacterized protein yjeF